MIKFILGNYYFFCKDIFWNILILEAGLTLQTPIPKPEMMRTHLRPKAVTRGGDPKAETKLRVPRTMAENTGETATRVSLKRGSLKLITRLKPLICWQNIIKRQTENAFTGPCFVRRWVLFGKVFLDISRCSWNQVILLFVFFYISLI